MKTISNALIGQYAVPLDHPITCANDAPWVIHEMKIELPTREWVNGYPKQFIKVWIRGENSIWFRADQCYIDTKEECELFLEMEQTRKQKDWLFHPLTIHC